MENLVTETVADQALTVSVEDETRLVSALPRNHSEELVLEKLTNNGVNAVNAEAPGADVIVDLVHGIDSLTKDEARARLLELEDDQEKTFFEIGGVLSAIQKHKWFEPCSSLDEWLKKNTAIKRSRARAWIRIYDAIIKSGVTWAKVKNLGWTKLNAVAGVLNGENAVHWIETASNHNRPETKKLVQEHLAGSGGRKLKGSTAARVKTFKFGGDQLKTVQAAIDRAKKIAIAEDDSAALEIICEDYAEGNITMSSDSLVETVAAHLSSLDVVEAVKFTGAIKARIRELLSSRPRSVATPVAAPRGD